VRIINVLVLVLNEAGDLQQQSNPLSLASVLCFEQAWKESTMFSLFVKKKTKHTVSSTDVLMRNPLKRSFFLIVYLGVHFLY